MKRIIYKVESKKDINQLVNTIFLLSRKDYDEHFINEKVFIYPYRILIFNKIKDGQLYWEGTDKELEELCNLVGKKYVDVMNEQLKIFFNQKVAITERVIVDSIEAPCKSLLLALKFEKGEENGQVVNNRRS